MIEFTTITDQEIRELVFSWETLNGAQEEVNSIIAKKPAFRQVTTMDEFYELMQQIDDYQNRLQMARAALARAKELFDKKEKYLLHHLTTYFNILINCNGTDYEVRVAPDGLRFWIERIEKESA